MKQGTCRWLTKVLLVVLRCPSTSRGRRASRARGRLSTETLGGFTGRVVVMPFVPANRHPQTLRKPPGASGHIVLTEILTWNQVFSLYVWRRPRVAGFVTFCYRSRSGSGTDRERGLAPGALRAWGLPGSRSLPDVCRVPLALSGVTSLPRTATHLTETRKGCSSEPSGGIADGFLRQSVCPMSPVVRFVPEPHSWTVWGLRHDATLLAWGRRVLGSELSAPSGSSCTFGRPVDTAVNGAAPAPGDLGQEGNCVSGTRWPLASRACTRR